MASRTLDGIDLATIAWVVQWTVPPGGEERLYAALDDLVLVGRDRAADIRLGAELDFKERAPRRWLGLSWHRGSVVVENQSRAGVDLLLYDADGEVVERQTVPAGFRGSPVAPDFSVLLDVPAHGDLAPVSYELVISTSPLARAVDDRHRSTDPVETVRPVLLTDRERSIGRALIRPLLEGRSARASLDAIVREADISRATVQRTISALDLRFLLAGMAAPTDGDQYDRVAFVVRRYPVLLRERS